MLENNISKLITKTLCLISACALLVSAATAQKRPPELRRGESPPARENRNVRTITIPVTLKGLREGATLQPTDLTVKEDGETREILSIRNTARAPLTLAVLIQDDVVSSIGNEIAALKNFIRNLPEGSRVMVGYISTGSLRVRQRFTVNKIKAAEALRIPVGSNAAAPFNPYVQIRSAARMFESQPTGRRAILVVTDGLDVSRGVTSASPSQSIDLDRAITEAQRRSVAVYGFYAPTVGATASGNSLLINYAQGSLQRIADETGGKAFFQGTGAPVSFDPFLRRLNESLSNQYALTYLSLGERNGFRKIEVLPELSGLEIDYPRGYRR